MFLRWNVAFLANKSTGDKKFHQLVGDHHIGNKGRHFLRSTWLVIALWYFGGGECRIYGIFAGGTTWWPTVVLGSRYPVFRQRMSCLLVSHENHSKVSAYCDWNPKVASEEQKNCFGPKLEFDNLNILGLGCTEKCGVWFFHSGGGNGWGCKCKNS